jgi:uncharacterized membrane protein
MRGADVAGLVGVGLMLAAYAGAQLHRLDPTRAVSLLMNLAGSLLVVVSLLHAFNLPAFLVEAAWAAIAAFGLVRLALRRLKG